MRPYAERILSAGWRGASVARQLLAFAKKNPRMNESVQVSTLLAEVRDLLRHLFPKSIRIEFDVTLEKECVRGDAGLLQQAILNLCLNARDAMPAGGVLRIAGKRPQKLPAGHFGPHVEITVEDSGTGMTDEIRRHIFDPFFTTKEKGTGLGLSVVSSIVSNHGGHLDVESSPGAGTRFHLILAEAVGAAAPRERATGMVRGQGQTILIVDDEEDLRYPLGQYLRRIGYKCLEAGDAAIALRLFSENEGGIAAVVTDYDMPGMDGAELARRIHAADASVPLILTSGYVESGPAGDLALPPGTRTLLKPFRLAEISNVIAQLISGRT